MIIKSHNKLNKVVSLKKFYIYPAFAHAWQRTRSKKRFDNTKYKYNTSI